MGARQEADFAADGADLVKAAAVQAFATIQYQTADRFLLDVIKRVVDNKIGDFFGPKFFEKLGADLILDRLAGGFSGELAGSEQRGHKPVAGELLGFLQDFIRDDVQRDFALLLARPGGELLLRGNERLAAFLAELECGIEIRLGDFLRRTFVHHDVRGVADIHQVKVAIGLFRMGRIGDELAVDAADAHGAQAGRPTGCH